MRKSDILAKLLDRDEEWIKASKLRCLVTPFDYGSAHDGRLRRARID